MKSVYFFVSELSFDLLMYLCSLNGLPAEWMEKLREDGMRDSDIISTHSRRQHRTTYLKNHPDISPDIIHSRTNSPFSPSTITSYPYSQSNVSNSNIGSSPSSSPVDERVSSPLTSSNHNHSLMNGASTDNTCQPATRTNGTGNAIPASALPTRSTSLRRPMGNLNGPRNASGRRQTTDSNAPYRLSHAHSDSTGRTPSLSTSSSHQSHLGEAFGYDESCAAGEAHENIHDGGIDVETEDDPNTATAAQFTIPNSATAAAFRQEGGNGGVGHGPGNGIERSIQGGFLPRMDEEPEDHHFLAHSDQRSQSPRSYSSSDEHLHPSERSCIANGPKVHGLKLRTRTDTASTMGTFRVVNASPPSPPPAYDPPPAGSPLEQYAQGRVGEKQSSNRLSPTPEGAEYRRSEETLTPKALLRGSLTNEESEDAEDEEPIRAPALPPRLSFNQEDFGSFDWSESLLSSLGTSVQTDVATTASTAPSLPLLEPAMKENPQPSETAPLSSPPKKSATVSPLVLSKGPAIPNVVIEIDQVQADSEEASGDMMQRQSSEGGYSSGRSISTTPLFNEVLSLVRQVPSSYGSNGSESSYVNSIANSNPKRGTDSPPLTSTYPYLPDPPSRPSPPRSAPVHSTQPSRSPSLSPAYSANLPSPPIPSPSFSPRSTDSHTESRASSSLQGYDYDFLNNPPSSNIRNSGTVREDRWSCTTTGTVATVRDVKEATIVHVRKASVGLANAFTVPAPSRSTSNPQLQAGSSSSSPISRDLSPARAREISAERGGGDTRRESYMSSDSNCSPEPAPVAEDFPLPPPSPISPSKGKFAAQPSPLSPTFSMNSNSGTVLAYLHPGLHSPRLSTAFHVPTTAKESVFVASPPPTIQTARDKPLSTSPAPSPSCSSSSSSSTSLQRSESKTVSATSCEDEPSPPLPTTVVSTPEPMSKKPAGKPAQFKIELRRSVGGHILSPTDSYLSGTSTESWLNGDGGSMVLDLEPIGVVIDANLSPNAAANTNGGNGQMRLSRGSSVGLAEPVMDWLVDSPSPSQIQSPALRDSVMMLGTSPKSQATSRETGNVEKEEFTSPRRPAITTEGIKSPSLSAIHVAKQQQNFLSPASANTSRSSNSTNSNNLSPSPSSVSSPLARYRGWVSEVVAPLEEFIDHDVEPREIFADMTEIAEGESGSVFSATLISLPSSRSSSSRSRTPPPPSYALSFSSQRESRKAGTKVAIKNVPLLPGGSPKLEDLRREMMLMSRVRHENVLSMDALYVDLVDDALWIEMELMERSLADVLALGDAGLRLDESTIARFSCDVLCALAYLEDQGIVHRDLRSDNLLVNSEGVLKIGTKSAFLSTCDMTENLLS